METLTPGQIWLVNRGKSSKMTKADIEAYLNAGGKILVHTVKRHNVTYGVKFTYLYTTEEYNDGVSYDLNYNTVTAMINRGDIFPDTDNNYIK